MPLGHRVPEFRGFTQHQLHVMRVTSLVVASISVAATILATFWFFRMRRSFRHDLIILLIQSNMLQAMWFVILPAVQLARGTVASGSPICQASGFFLAFSIEACDVAIVLIGLHTALYIFRGGNGLYPYRRAAYLAFVLVPLLLASLPFVNKPAYTNSGQYCYLPANPDWTRRVLSWIPRYVIIATVCIAYVSTYVHVNFLMKGFGKAEMVGREGLSTAGDPGHQRQRTVSVPPTPPIADHGLIPPTPPCENGSADRRHRKQYSHARPGSRGTYALEEQRYLASVPENSIQWKMPTSGIDSTVPSHQQDTYFSHPNLESRESCQCTLEEVPRSRGDSTPNDLPSTPLRSESSASRHFWNRSIAGTATSSPSNIQAMSQHGRRSSDSSASIFLSPTLSPATLDATGMAKTRYNIRRRTRQLFIYPIVYILVWIVPFAYHVTPERKSSFGLALASLISLCLQGIADSLVFSILEKPWRHPRRAKGSCWRFWCPVSWPGRQSAVDGAAANVGRTREETLVDSRIARRRRDEELAERRLRQLAPHSARQEWWDDLPLERVEESGPKASDDGGSPW